MNIKKLRNKLVVSLTTLFLSLLLVETGLHISGLFSPASFYTMPPNSALKDVQTDWNLTYQTNGEGLRDDEYAPQKRDGVIRIALIGDSYTFGQGCERGEIFPDILEATLRAEGYPVEVINISNIGIGPDAYFLLLRDVAARYEPDIVILNVFGNDASDIYAPSLFKRLIKKASNYSHLLTLVRVARRKLSASMQGDFWQTVDTNVNQAEAVEAEAKRRRIEEFKKDTARRSTIFWQPQSRTRMRWQDGLIRRRIAWAGRIFSQTQRRCIASASSEGVSLSLP